jgi:hypothetical protein
MSNSFLYFLIFIMASQVLKVIGEIEIISKTGAYEENDALLSFKASNGNRLGSIRTYGGGPYNFMLIDSTKCLGGLELRGNTSEGSSTVGGLGDAMSFTVREGKCGAKFMNIRQGAWVNQFGQTQMYGYPNLEVSRQNTDNSFSLQNTIAMFTQSQWKAGESMNIALGFDKNQGSCTWGYEMPTGSYSDPNNTAYIGMVPNYNVLNKNLVFANSGDVSTEHQFSADTIYANTYLNLPTIPPAPSDLLPLTLNPTEQKVGINQTAPAEALDVVGNALIGGNLNAISLYSLTLDTDITSTANLSLTAIPNTPKPDVLMYDPTTKAVSYGAIPVQDLNPLTLDNTNDRVGINQAVPTEALDVVGNVLISGNLNTGNVTALGLSSSTLDTDLTTTENLSLTAIANTPKPDVLMYDSTTKSVSYGAIPVQDLTPITLDTTNTPNRVGINKAAPGYTLDVNGSLRTGKLIVLGSSGETLIWTDTPNNFVGIGTTTPTTLLDVDGNAKIKTLELTEISSSTTSNVLYYDSTTKSVSYGSSPVTPTSTWAYPLTTSRNLNSNQVTNILSVNLPVVGYYSVELYLRCTANTFFEIAMSTSSSAMTYSFPATAYTVESIISAAQSTAHLTYKVVTPGTHYINVKSQNRNNALPAYENVALISFKGA